MSIRYLRTAYLDAATAKYSEKATDFAIHDVIQMVDLDRPIRDSLALLPYRLLDIFTLLDRDGVLRSTPSIIKRLEDYPRISAGSIILIHRDNLYGVLIRNGVAQIVGCVRTVLSSIDRDRRPQNCVILASSSSSMIGDEDDNDCDRTMRITSTASLSITESQLVSYDPRRHVLITVPLGAYFFVPKPQLLLSSASQSNVQLAEPLEPPASLSSDESGDDNVENDNDNNAETTAIASISDAQNHSLVLLVGTSFLLLQNVSLEWIKYTDCYMRQTSTISIDPGRVLFAYSGGIVPATACGDSGAPSGSRSGSASGANVDNNEEHSSTCDARYLIHGIGPRISGYNEAYYYALMHVGKSFNREPAH